MESQKVLDRHIIQDLLCRFIINQPENEREYEKVIKNLEIAHWYYTDFIATKENRKKIKNLPNLQFSEFAENLITYLNFFPDPRFKKIQSIDTFRQNLWKQNAQIPVYGAIIFNEEKTKVLLVNNLKKISYSFPKGKINENETGIQCAAREVWEEIGFQCGKYLSEQNVILFKPVDQRLVKLYIVDGISENTVFQTQVRGEVGSIDWVTIEQIEKGYQKNKKLFSNIIPFLESIKLYVKHSNQSLYKSQILKDMENRLGETFIQSQQQKIIFNGFKKKIQEQVQEFDNYLQNGFPSKPEDFGQDPFLQPIIKDKTLLRAAFE